MARKKLEKSPDLEGFRARLKQLIEQVGSEAELERRARLPLGTLSHYTRDRASEPRRPALVALAKAADVRLEWLAAGEGSVRADHLNLTAGSVALPGFDVCVNRQFVNYLYPNKEWLKHTLHIEKPECVALVQAYGGGSTSPMAPLINDGDLMLVDASDRDLVDGGIYVLGIDHSLRVRRVERGVGGKIILRPNQPGFGEIEITEDDVKQVSFVGRVIFVARPIWQQAMWSAARRTLEDRDLVLDLTSWGMEQSPVPRVGLLRDANIWSPRLRAHDAKAARQEVDKTEEPA